MAIPVKKSANAKRQRKVRDVLGPERFEKERWFHALKRFIVDQAQKLLSPAEMGELFKVLALGRGVTQPLIGFLRSDRRATL